MNITITDTKTRRSPGVRKYRWSDKAYAAGYAMGRYSVNKAPTVRKPRRQPTVAVATGQLPSAQWALVPVSLLAKIKI